MKRIGARTITALVVPDPTVAHRILLLNTEKSARPQGALARGHPPRRGDGEARRSPGVRVRDRVRGASLLTLGISYDKNPRLAGATYHSVLKRVESWSDEPVSQALVRRRAMAKRLLALDEAVGKVVDQLKERGFQSPYLRPFVVARINPLRWKKGAADFDETMDTMLAGAKKFDVSKIKPGQISAGGGGAE